jgi:Phage minor capsid protein 2
MFRFLAALFGKKQIRVNDIKINKQKKLQDNVFATIEKAKDLNQDLLKVSSHSNESEFCQKWSGKILSISGKDKKYPSLKDALNDGLFRRGCRHSPTIFVQTNIKFKTWNSKTKEYELK